MWGHTIGCLAVNTVRSVVHTILHQLVTAQIVEILDVIGTQSGVLLKPEWLLTGVRPFAVICKRTRASIQELRMVKQELDDRARCQV